MAVTSGGLPIFRRSRAARPSRPPGRGCGRRACAGSPRRGGRRSSRERNRRSAISALRRPSATSASTSTSRAVSPAGFSRVDARGPRRRSRIPRSRSRARDAPAARVRAEALRGGEAAPLRGVSSSESAEGERRLVGAAERRPGRRGGHSTARELEREGLGHVERELVVAPARRRQSPISPRQPAVAALRRELERAVVSATASARSPCQPRRLAAGGATGASRCSLADAAGELKRLVERRPTHRGRRGARADCPTTASGDDRGRVATSASLEQSAASRSPRLVPAARGQARAARQATGQVQSHDVEVGSAQYAIPSSM